MPRRTALTGVDKTTGFTRNILTDFEGNARLSGRNLFPNGDLSQDDPDGNLRYWTLGSSPPRRGWFFYLQEPGRPAYRQQTTPFGLQRDSVRVTSPLVIGPEPPDPNDRARVSRPATPEVELVDRNIVGFPAVVYEVYVYYVVGSLNVPVRQMLRTRASQPVEVEIQESGQGMRVYPGETVPEGVTGIGVALRQKDGAIQTARTQRIQNVRQGVPEFVALRGQFIAGVPIAASNETFVGGFQDEPPPLVGLQSVGRGLNAGHYRFAVEQRTQFGWSASSRITGWSRIGRYLRGTTITVRPRRFIPGFQAWRLLIQGFPIGEPNPGAWTTLTTPQGFSEFPRRFIARIGGFAANDYPGWGSLSNAERRMEDETGIDDPDIELEEPELFGGAPLEPGPKIVRTTWAIDGDGESPPSRGTRIVVPAEGGSPTSTIAVRRPPGVNEEYNAVFERLEPSTGNEEDWEAPDPQVPRRPNTPNDGEAEHRDRNDRTEDTDVRRSRPRPLPNASDLITERLGMSISEYVSGQVEGRLEFLNGLGNVIQSNVMARMNTLGDRIAARTHGSGPRADIQRPAAATHVRKVVRHVATSRHGARNLTSILRHAGAVAGAAHQLKRFARSPAGPEIAADDYPAGGYSVVVDEPERRPVQNLSREIVPPTFFGSSIPSEYLLRITGDGVGEITDQAPVSGEHSFQVRSQDGGRAWLQRNVTDEELSTLSYFLRFSTEFLPTRSIRIAEIRTGAAEQLAHVNLNPDGRLTLVAQRDETTWEAEYLSDDISDRELVDMEIAVSRAGTNVGIVRLYVRHDGSDRRLATRVTDVDLTGRYPQQIRLGSTAARSGVEYAVKFDDVYVHEEHGGEEIPGRMVEYFGPPGTPPEPEHLMAGARLPVTQETDYTLSAFLEYFGVTRKTLPFIFTAKNATGETLRTYRFVEEGIVNRALFYRHARPFTTPRGTAYLEFERGNGSDGLSRAMGFQLDRGPLTPFTNEIAPDGEVVVTFPMGVPGVDSDWFDYNEVTRYVEAGYQGDEPDGTQIAVDFAHGPAPDSEDFSEWITDISSVPPEAGAIKLRATLTAESTVSPELSEMFVDFARSEPALLRADGTEFPGGAVVFDFPQVRGRRARDRQTRANYTRETAVWGERRQRVEGFGVECYLDETAEEIGQIVDDGETLMVEALGRRYLLRLDDLELVPQRDTEHPAGGRSAYIFQADGLEADVEEHEDYG